VRNEFSFSKIIKYDELIKKKPLKVGMTGSNLNV